MVKLKQLPQGATVKRILPQSLITVVDAQWLRPEALKLIYKDASGKLGNELV